MRYQTHILTSVSGALILDQTTDLNITAAIIGGVVIGSLLPDVDEPQSYIGRKTTGVSNLTKTVFGHRGFTHTILATGLFSGFLALIYMLFGYIEGMNLETMKEKVLISLMFTSLMALFLYLIGDILKKFGTNIPYFKNLKLTVPIIFIMSLIIENNALYLFTKEVFLGIAMGYGLHILGDMFSKSGVPLLMPLTNYKFKIYLYKTGGKREQLIKIISVVYIIYYLYIKL